MPKGHGIFRRWKNPEYQPEVGTRTQKQKEFAAEQEKQNAELDALHRKNHPERYKK
jgi:hypothetical protein